MGAKVRLLQLTSTASEEDAIQPSAFKVICSLHHLFVHSLKEFQ
jgi:hypothetical protein